MVKIYLIIAFAITTNLSYTQNIDSTEYASLMLIETEPVFDGCLKKFVKNNIVYPNSAHKDSLEGIVSISFWIDTLGMTYDHKIVKGVRNDIDKEAIRVAKLIKFKEPARQRGKPINVRYVVPIEFRFTEKIYIRNMNK
jgi:TonB family protein